MNHFKAAIARLVPTFGDKSVITHDKIRHWKLWKGLPKVY